MARHKAGIASEYGYELRGCYELYRTGHGLHGRGLGASPGRIRGLVRRICILPRRRQAAMRKDWRGAESLRRLRDREFEPMAQRL